jgi:dihydropteroate synthase
MSPKLAKVTALQIFKEKMVAKAYNIWGIVNVTPDSFSDGDPLARTEDFVDRALTFVADGADIIDIGGESTRVGSTAISADEELSRVIPVIEILRRRRCSVPISIDTNKAVVADHALAVGASIVNDIFGLQGDGAMAAVAAKYGAPAVAMYRRPSIVGDSDILEDISTFWKRSLAIAGEAGVKNVFLDVGLGVGFHKTLEQNLHILRNLGKLRNQFSANELLLGASRKSFLGEITGELDPRRRDLASVSIAQFAYFSGIRHFRMHNVTWTKKVLTLAEVLGD